MASPLPNPPADPPQDDGEDLLARFRDGDRSAFDDLVLAFHARLVQFFYRLCWDLGRSEDLTQNLFLKLLRSSARYRPEGKLATFIFRVATNLWIDHYRAARPRGRLYSLDQAIVDGWEPAGTQTGPADRVVAGEDRARLRAALEKLTEPHRLVFELAIYQELPYAEVGAILDIPVGTVKSRMHNAVKALRTLLDDAAEPPAGGRQAATFRGSRRLGGATG